MQLGVLKFREGQVEETATFLSWVVSCSQGQVVVCPSLNHNSLDASTCPQAVILSSAPGGWLVSQEPGWALSVVSETKALTYTLLARLIMIYLKLKFSNTQVPNHTHPTHRVHLEYPAWVIGEAVPLDPTGHLLH